MSKRGKRTKGPRGERGGDLERSGFVSGLEEGSPGGDGRKGKEERSAPQKYHLAFIVAILWWIVLTSVLLIPGIGWLLFFTLVPFVAGRRGGRRLERRYAVEMAVLVALLLSLLELALFYLQLHKVALWSGEEVRTGVSEYVMIGLAIVSNVFFCMAGAATSKLKRSGSPSDKEK